MADGTGEKPDTQTAAAGDDAGAVPSMAAAPVDKKRLAVIENFVEAFIKGAKTMALYEKGHEMIMQIVGRVNNLLKSALGHEPNLTVNVKSKNILYEGNPLEETEEMIGFASSLHVLGIGQIMFGDKLADEGMLKFMKMVTERPDLKRTLVDMQQGVHTTRIDGLQLVSIVSAIETVEEVEEQTPGQLTPEQVEVFSVAKTLPDFLFMLFYQNEPLTGKKADNLTILFDEVMDHSIPLSEFQSNMPWDLYDPKILQAWSRLVKEIEGRKKWTRDLLLSDLSVQTEEDHAFREAQKSLEAETAFKFSLAEVHLILEKPAGDKQPKYAMFAYMRLLEDLGRRGDLAGMLKEVDTWRTMANDKKWAAYLAALRKDVQERVPTRAMAASLVRAVETPPEAPMLQEYLDFILTVGHTFIPMLLEETREIKEREHRQTLSSILVSVCRRLGPEDLFDALEDEDYFQLLLVVGILTELNMPGSGEKVVPLLKNKNAKVRRAVLQSLRKFGGAASVDGMADFIVTHEDEDEAKLAVTSLSLVNHDSVGKKLVEIYLRKEAYNIRVALVTALGRFGSQDTLNFLESLDHWGWLEFLTGKNKGLRDAVRSSIEQVKKDLSDGS